MVSGMQRLIKKIDKIDRQNAFFGILFSPASKYFPIKYSSQNISYDLFICLLNIYFQQNIAATASNMTFIDIVDAAAI